MCLVSATCSTTYNDLEHIPRRVSSVGQTSTHSHPLPNSIYITLRVLNLLVSFNSKLSSMNFKIPHSWNASQMDRNTSSFPQRYIQVSLPYSQRKPFQNATLEMKLFDLEKCHFNTSIYKSLFKYRFASEADLQIEIHLNLSNCATTSSK